MNKIFIIFIVLLIVCNLLFQLILGFWGVMTRNQMANPYITSVVNAALVLEADMQGPRLNQYNPDDIALLTVRRNQSLDRYWATECGTIDAQHCDYAASGSLECVYFVMGAFAIAGHPIPAHPDAYNFMNTYAQPTIKQDWQEFSPDGRTPGTQQGFPQPADIAVWSGGDSIINNQHVALGHVAVVVSVDPQHKWLIVAGGNTSYGGVDLTKLVDPKQSTQSKAPRDTLSQTVLTNPALTAKLDYKLYKMAILTNGTVATWDGYKVEGFIRNKEAKMSQMQSFFPNQGDATTVVALKDMPNLPNSPYVMEAWNDATNAGINPTYFVRQINQESHFRPDVVSSAGAVGIAQFLPSTAQGLGVDPLDPEAALSAAANLVAKDYHRYYDASAPNATYIAYEKAFAAYNTGEGNVDAAVKACGTGWLICVACETKAYLRVIMDDATIQTCTFRNRAS